MAYVKIRGVQSQTDVLSQCHQNSSNGVAFWMVSQHSVTRKKTTNMLGLKLRRVLVVGCVLLVGAQATQGDDLARLSEQLKPWLQLTQGKVPQFTLTGETQVSIDGIQQAIRFELIRSGDEDFDLVLEHQDYAASIRRRHEGIALALPKHGVVFLGQGLELAKDDHLRPQGIAQRLVGRGTELNILSQMLGTANASDLAGFLMALVSPTYSSEQDAWLENEHWLRFGRQPISIEAGIGGSQIKLSVLPTAETLLTVDDWPGFRVETMPRAALEHQLARGARRALEILAPSSQLTSPKQRNRKVEHGELRWVEGQRVALLHGTPEQIGVAHAQLLQVESQRCIDSVLYAFGTVQTVITGRWFRNDLDEAYARLAVHIPERHKLETRAMAVGLGLEPDLVEALNVFPEMFHCSGFALFGSATIDGKLVHGRVLDYMTTIGLQDAATTFIVAPTGQIAFANVGYAGFTGSVSGMNAAQISLGEMGGRGEGEWDGVPMATLMRRALEECSSLEQVKQLWSDSPRTCEYYYVFADGQQRSAVGVAATPESIQFIAPGESHSLLGEGIPDAVVLSADERLQELRRRVQAGHGQIDIEAACQLMSRPVAMESNLHNVLFVPEDGLLYVANATHRQPAAERPYLRLDLRALLREMPGLSSDPESVTHRPIKSLPETRTFIAEDSLDIGEESSKDALACLNSLAWKCEQFDVHLERAREHEGDWLVRFPSARPVGNHVNDLVAMEWYQARTAAGEPMLAPAAVVVHESGSGMTVGRLIAKSLRSKGIHTFMLQLPYYGARRGAGAKPDGSQLGEALCQSVVDARRAHDAVAALPFVDNRRIALQGTSLGGFVTATTAGLDQAYAHVFILLAGGDLYDVLKNGRRDAVNVRQAMMADGMGDSEFRNMLQRIEPLRLAHRVDPQRVWLFSGRYDDVVPPKNSELLAQAAGLDDKHHIKMLANHYSGIVFLPMISEQMGQIIKN